MFLCYVTFVPGKKLLAYGDFGHPNHPGQIRVMRSIQVTWSCIRVM